MHNILITGANGQLGKCILDEYNGLNKSEFNFIFKSREELDITSQDDVNKELSSTEYEYLINCAAYTNVNGAESDEETANKINGDACSVLAISCGKHNVKLIHISTDYVFDGNCEVKYENSPVNPLQVYGKSKLEGEVQIQMVDAAFGLDYIIIRTSWLYSKYGNNFMKTMINKFHVRDIQSLKVVCDQVGSPTSAHDLAKFIVHNVVVSCIHDVVKFEKGIYHYSNEGIISWYDFAHAIHDIASEYDDIPYITFIPCSSDEWPSPCKRPGASILSKDKIKETYNTVIPYWRVSLRNVLEKYYNIQ